MLEVIEIEVNKQEEFMNVEKKDLFNGETKKEDLTEIAHVRLEDLSETNLPCKSTVYVSYANNPSDFVVFFLNFFFFFSFDLINIKIYCR